MNAILLKNLKNGVVKTVKIEGVATIIGYAICCLFLILLGLEMLAVMYIFAIVTSVALLVFTAWTIFVILLNEHYKVKQSRNGIVS